MEADPSILTLTSLLLLVLTGFLGFLEPEELPGGVFGFSGFYFFLGVGAGGLGWETAQAALWLVPPAMFLMNLLLDWRDARRARRARHGKRES
jgi:phosphatidylglycerophosphate synthase